MSSTGSFHDQHRIVGRQREQERLTAYLDRAASGDGTLVLISGEAGIGKTTLVRWLVDQAREQDILALSGACYDLTITPPYGPWSEAIRDYQPGGDRPAVPAWFDNPDELQKIGSQAALFEEAHRFFTSIAEVQPLLIVLEDLHWADLASLDALRYLARSFGSARILLVVTYRDDEITRRHELYQLLPLLVRESQVQRIHLSQFEHDDVRQMVTSRYALTEPDIDRLVAHVSDRSEGNPFFAGEILQGLEDERVLHPDTGGWTLGALERERVPVLLRQALDTRLDRLSPEIRASLRVAAVIGQVVPLDLWQRVTGLEGEGFERIMTEALEAHVLEEGGTGGAVQFRHALLREALYESLALSQRRTWHRTVGEILAESPNPDPDAVAHHFQQAGDQRSAHWLIRAGLRAEGSYALRVAADHYVAAQALLEADPNWTRARGWLLLHIGHLLRFSDRPRGLAHLEDALHVAQQVDDPVLAASGQMQQGLLRCLEGDLGTGLADMERGHQIMDGATPLQEQSALQVIRSLFPAEAFSHRQGPTDGIPFLKAGNLVGVNLLRRTYVTWLAFAGRFNEAMRVGEQFVDQATAPTFGLATAADWLGQPEQAHHWRRLALNYCEATGHKYLVRGTQYWELQHLLRYRTDQLAERRRVTAAVIAASKRATGAVQGLPPCVWSLPLDLLEGRWDVARDLARVTLRDRQDPLVHDLRIRVFEVLRREQVDEDFARVVQEKINASIPDGPATEPGNTTFIFAIAGQQLAAHVALDRGELDLARDWIEALDRWLDWSGAVLGRAESQLLWARYHQIAGVLDTAQLHAQQALEHAANPRQPLALIATHRALGQLETVNGGYDEAADHLRTSLDLAQRCEAPYEQALTMLELTELAVCTGDSSEARRLLGEVREICESIGANRSLDRVHELEKRLPGARGSYPAGLSSREVEVLRLVAQGLTNAEIGEQLYISQRTVAQHLRSVYNKLGVNSRAAAVARIAEYELT